MIGMPLPGKVRSLLSTSSMSRVVKEKIFPSRSCTFTDTPDCNRKETKEKKRRGHESWVRISGARASLVYSTP